MRSPTPSARAALDARDRRARRPTGVAWWALALVAASAGAACADRTRDVVGRVSGAPASLTRACVTRPANTTGGTETSTDQGRTWSACQGFNCVDTYTWTNGACAPLPQTRACTTQPANSTGGSETSTDGGRTWSACQGFTCLNHYELTGGACTPMSYTLTILAAVHGSVAGATSGTRYPYGTPVDLTARPDLTYGVRGWTGDALACGPAATCRITMDADKTVGVHIGKAPLGFAADVTGGEGGEVVTPTTGIELEAALCSSVVSGRCVDAIPRVVQLTSVFDFRGAEGTATSPGCRYSNGGCTLNGKTEEVLAVQDFCAGATTTYTISYDAAGTRPLRVGSNKTLVGIGAGAGLRGKGLRLADGASNVIVRNLSVSDINEGIIWAGDGITVDAVSRVWLDHLYLARMGRAFIVTGYGTAAGVTISNTIFDGTTACGHYCDGRHYWNALLLAQDQRITFVGNQLRNGSGDAPQLGKAPTAASRGVVHVVNNAWSGSAHLGLVTGEGVVALVEGNAFADAGASFEPIHLSSTADLVFAPLEAAVASATPACQAALGRPCAGNRATGSTGGFVLNPAAISTIQATPAWAQPLGGLTPLDPASVPSAVGATAGPVPDPDA